jgi:hypothetical protein
VNRKGALTLQIQQEQCAAGELAQRRDHIDRFAIGKMTQHRRSKDEIEGMLREGKVKRIRCQPR